MTGTYNPLFVAISLLVAIAASYTALNMASRLATANRRDARWWLAGGTLAMGLGIWSMHFIGMLALHLPIATGHDIGLTVLSLLAALAASGFALWLSARPHLSWPVLLLGGLVMGSGIAAMHYLGMAAMRMQPGIVYDPLWLGISLLIAMIAATAALWLTHHLRRQQAHGLHWRMLAALLMGCAIIGMHYSGMAAAQFAPDSLCLAAGSGMDNRTLAAMIIATTASVMATALLAVLFDRQMQLRTEILDARLASARHRLQQASLHDPLTGLPNRSLLTDRIGQAIAKAARQRQLIAVQLVNLDDFRLINELHGHACGDQVLLELTRRMSATLRADDTLARLGGDEFVVVSAVNGPGEAALLAGRLLAAITAPAQREQGPVSVQASIGIALYPQDGQDERALISHANTAMEHGRQHRLQGGHTFFTSAMQAAAERQLRLLQDLRGVLQRDELVLYYQPKLMAAGKPVIGAEALLRWQHPALGLLMPDCFIPLAERSGLIVPIGDWVLDQACAQLHQWHQAGHRQWSMAVNLSAVQFNAPGLVHSVAAALQRHQIPADRLTLEVTESTAMRDVEASLKILGELSAMGVHIAIDDFGTGYSSLLYLKRLPATELKIDRAFVRDLHAGSEDAAIVASIIALGRSLQMRIVAEGVETAAQQGWLDAMGCDQLQGYHFDRPLDAASFNKAYCGPAAALPEQARTEAAIRYCAAQ